MTLAPASTSTSLITPASSLSSGAGRSAKTENAAIRLLSTLADRATDGSASSVAAQWMATGSPRYFTRRVSPLPLSRHPRTRRRARARLAQVLFRGGPGRDRTCDLGLKVHHDRLRRVATNR